MTELTRKLGQAQEDFVREQDTVFRVYTENLPGTSALFGRYFGGFTVISAQGYWRGTFEASLIFEVIGKGSDLQNVIHAANDIRHVNHQQAVLVAWQDSKFHQLLLTE